MENNKKFSDYFSNDLLDINKVIEEYSSYVYFIIKNNKFALNIEDIEEVASDVFLVVWKNQEKIEIEKKVTPYLAGITKNLIYKKMRDSKINVVNIEDFENIISDPNFKIDIEENEKEQIILEIVEKMKLEDKNIFMLYYYDSYSIKNIAKKLIISETKVKTKLYRIRKNIRKELEKRRESYA